MPIVATQGLSENYDQATGSYDSIERGEISRDELLVLFEKISKLSGESDATWSQDYCPPSVLIKIDREHENIGFLGESGVLHCNWAELHSAEITPEQAVGIVCGELNITDVEGYKPPPEAFHLGNLGRIVLLIVAVVLIGAIVAAFV